MTRAVLRSASLVLAISVTCCGSPPETQWDASGSTPLDDAETPAPPPTEPEGCGMVFSPVAELLEATEIAAARWSTATGCDVRVGEGGLPVTEQTDMRDRDGDPVNGRALVYSDAVTREYARCDGLVLSTTRAERTVAHEMGHCLGAMGHASAGMLSEYADGGDLIDAAALDLVCANLACAGFNPEG